MRNIFKVVKAYRLVSKIYNSNKDDLLRYDIVKLDDGRLSRSCDLIFNISKVEHCAKFLKTAANNDYIQNINKFAAVMKAYHLDELVDISSDNFMIYLKDEDDQDYDENSIAVHYDMIFTPNIEYEPDFDSYKAFKVFKIILTILIILLCISGILALLLFL